MYKCRWGLIDRMSQIVVILSGSSDELSNFRGTHIFSMDKVHSGKRIWTHWYRP